VHPTADLPRVSSFPELKGYRSIETGTYVRYPLDEQPKISEADDELSWLEGVLCDWSVATALSYFVVVVATRTGPVLVPRTSRVQTCRRRPQLSHRSTPTKPPASSQQHPEDVRHARLAGGRRARHNAPCLKRVMPAERGHSLGASVCDHVSIDPVLRSEEVIDTCHHCADIALDSSACDEIKGLLITESRSGVRCPARSVAAGHQ
jgi:hypothetical protein